MTAYRLSLSARSEGPLADFLAAHEDLRIEGTPVGNLLLLRCSGDPETVDDAADSLASHFVTRHIDREGDILTLVVEAPPEEAHLLERAEASEGLLLPPLVWNEGRVHVRILLFDELRASAVSDLLPGATLEAKTVLRGGEVDRELLASGLLLPSLTRRQGQAVLAALETGYYDAPRKVTTEDVARKLDIARSTFEEHLKAAESQLVRALAPVVRMRLLEEEQGRQAAGAEALHLYAKFSKDLGLYVHMAIRGERVAQVTLASQPPSEPHSEDHPYLARILEHLATGRDDLQDIPLDLRVTPFEREVLDLLRTVPPGEVITYGDLAARLGKPKAMRAVGNACAMNPAIIVVPCHRVVPAAGGVGNYGAAGGAATKRKILEREGGLRKVKGAARPAQEPHGAHP